MNRTTMEAQRPEETTDQNANSGEAPRPHDPVIDDGPAGDVAAPLPGGDEPPAPPGDIFDTTTTFAAMGLRNSVLKGIEACGFLHPTATQAKFLPVVMSGKDVLGQAKTGTGKTAAFALPMLNNLSRDIPFQAIILAPTRELAIQITAEIDELGQFTPIKATTVYGGEDVRRQADKLTRGSQILVGTPGRVMDMLERGHIHFNNIKSVVLDEVDRMLDIGFREDIRKILEKIPQQHQTVLVSATISDEIERLARKYMHEPEKLIVVGGSLTVSLVKQYYLTVAPWDKKRLLLHLLRHEEPALTLVFCRLKRHVDEIARGLSERGIDAHAIHGDMPQGRRNQTMKRLREGELGVLVASDLASRGIDVDGITHVINFDLPEDPEIYVHRIGRTARAGRHGVAWSFVTPDQGDLLTTIEMLINTEVPRLDYPDFKHAETAPPGYRPPLDDRRNEGLKPVQPPLNAEGKVIEPPAPKPVVSRIEATMNLAVPSAEAGKVDLSKFPGGLVPSKLPPKRLIKGLRTGRK